MFAKNLSDDITPDIGKKYKGLKYNKKEVRACLMTNAKDIVLEKAARLRTCKALHLYSKKLLCTAFTLY